MDRILEFRGKTLSGQWVYGNVTHLQSHFNGISAGYYISNSAGAPFAYNVRPETIGQFTSRNDDAGDNLYEGDVIRNNVAGVYEVYFSILDTAFAVRRLPAKKEKYLLGQYIEMLRKAQCTFTICGTNCNPSG